ncbi:MAG: XisI protein [Okeania sp. SIO2C9]|uniref:XisI protein n=1 Tax=Okeania sp. SIO2C9 TaxID=2607791 RepID=UPI0013C13355|nr:XisI protein [Okeania sp. SIO2C9]
MPQIWGTFRVSSPPIWGARGACIIPRISNAQLLNVGWDGNERIRGCVLQIDIKNEKIWIQHDGTKMGIADELVDLGVPSSDIVLAFHAPYKRKYTGFAVS